MDQAKDALRCVQIISNALVGSEVIADGVEIDLSPDLDWVQDGLQYIVREINEWRIQEDMRLEAEISSRAEVDDDLIDAMKVLSEWRCDGCDDDAIERCGDDCHIGEVISKIQRVYSVLHKTQK